MSEELAALISESAEQDRRLAALEARIFGLALELGAARRRMEGIRGRRLEGKEAVAA